MGEGQDEWIDACSRLGERREQGEDISEELKQLEAWREREFPEDEATSTVLKCMHVYIEHKEGLDRSKSSLDNSKSSLDNSQNSPCPDVQSVPQVVHVAPCNRIHISDIVYLGIFFAFLSMLYLMFRSHRQVYT